VNDGPVKVSPYLQRAYGEAVERLAQTNPRDAAVIRKHVAEVREEASFWRRRFRNLERGGNR